MKLKTSHIVFASLGGLAAVLVFLLVALLGTFNEYARIEVRAKALQTDNQNVLENTRKAIREAAAVSDKEVDGLIAIITGYAEARGPNPDGGDGNIVSIGMVREAVPAVTEIKTLTRLQNIVVAGRKDWQAAQTRLIEEKRRGDEMLATIPSGAVLRMFGKKEIEIQIITSSETKENFRTGEDNSQWIGGKS